MDATTSDPPPELSLIEQFGAWLDAFPAVPAWLQWIGVGLTIGAPTITFLWVRWGANWWAARSRNAAEKRARKLVKRVAEMHALSKNRPAMLVDGLNVIIALVLTSLFVVAGLVQLGNVFGPSNLGQPPSDFMTAGRTALAMSMHVVATCIMIVFLFLLSRIQPLADLDRYTEKSRTRIEKLLVKAGIADEIMVEFLRVFDALVDAARKQEIR